MLLDSAAVRDPPRAGSTDNYGLIWTTGILLRIRRLAVRMPPSAAGSQARQGVSVRVKSGDSPMAAGAIVPPHWVIWLGGNMIKQPRRPGTHRHAQL
jgi:hypothetical protein